MTITLRRTTFEQTCSVCHVRIAPGAGYYNVERNASGKWTAYCIAHRPLLQNIDWAEPAKEEPSMAYDAAPQTPAFDDATLERAITTIAARTAEHFTKHVPPMVLAEVKAYLDAVTPRELHVTINKTPKVTFKQHHKALPAILAALASGSSPMLVGPAGSGKTTLAEQCATALKLPFYMAARVTSEFKLVGFVNAVGATVRTQFREAYEHGGVFLFDEVDASDPDAMTAFNAALANGLGDFPDGMVKRHKDFYAIAAGNTYGRGADRQYVGRNQLDAATLDRFQAFDVDYDEALELQLANDDAWVKYVQSVRRAIEHEKVRHIVSPRASIMGAKMLAQGMDRALVENATIWKGLPADARQRVEYHMASQGGM